MSPLLIGILVVVGFLFTLIPASLTLMNMREFHRSPTQSPTQAVSVLVPARNEADAIRRLITDVFANHGVQLELLILDDESTDGTGDLVATIAKDEPRLQLLRGTPLPDGWCGKQFACATLAEHANNEILLFVDVDVSLAPDAIKRSLAYLDVSGADLVSGFPKQITHSFLEWLLIPLIHYLLLGYLPIRRSRLTGDIGMAAGCGQWFLTHRTSYFAAGGHEAIKASLHDGIMLPRAYRRAGLTTDIFDASDIASCRMYSRSIDVFFGLAKNATEGIGNPQTILPFTVLLAGGSILPIVLVATGFLEGWNAWSAWTLALAVVAAVLAYLPRCLNALRFQESMLSVVAHPFGVMVFLGIQWFAFIRRFLGYHTSWRGRTLKPQ
ncbi:MAG: glycosyltransferase family 2 protein [Pirellulales bacterium]